MKVIVTGGLGFIGCNFIKYILQSHNEEYKILNSSSRLSFSSSLEGVNNTIIIAESEAFLPVV